MNKFLFTALVLMICSGLFAANIGGSTELTGKLYKNTDQDTEKYGDITFTLHGKFPLTKDNHITLSCEGLFTQKYTDYYMQDADTPSLIDINLCKLTDIITVSSSERVILSLGRYLISDLTGIVLSQVNDGAMIQYISPKLNVSVYGGWTGLLNAQTASLIDKADTDFSYDSNSLYDFASSYAIGEASLSFPYILFNQSLSFENVLMMGTNGINSDNSGFWRNYMTMALNGPLSSSIFYNTFVCIGSEKDEDTSLLAKLKIDWYTGFKSSCVSLSTTYASGEQGSLVPFKAVTSGSATSSYLDPEYSGLIKAGGSLSVKPAANLLVSAGSDVAYRIEEDKYEYDGFQYNASVRYQLYTDFCLNSSITQYIAEDKAADKIQFTIGAVLSY